MMTVLELIALGIGCSVGAAILVRLFWLCQIRWAARRFLGTWTQFNLDGRRMVPAELNPIAVIRRGLCWWPPNILLYNGEHDDKDASNPGRRRKLEGRIVINPIAVDRATATLHYPDKPDEAEFAAQDYFVPADP